MWTNKSLFDRDAPEYQPKRIEGRKLIAKNDTVEIPTRELEDWYDTLNRLDDTHGNLLDLRDAIYRYLR